MTILEAAAFLGISRAGVYRLVASGDLVKVRLGGRSHVSSASVEAVMGHAVAAATPPGGIPLGEILAGRPARPDGLPLPQVIYLDGLPWHRGTGTLADLEDPPGPQEGPAGPAGPG